MLLPGAVYVGAWLLMTAAMMLPTALPLLEIFRRMIAARTARAHLLTFVTLGYLGVWSGFGVVAHLADQGVHALALRSALAHLQRLAGRRGGAGARRPVPVQHAQVPLPGRVSVAARLHRPPLARRNAPREAPLLGARHGLYCVGCCCGPMMLMFVVGMGNVGWMLLLGTVMAVETNLPLGAAPEDGARPGPAGRLGVDRGRGRPRPRRLMVGAPRPRRRRPTAAGTLSRDQKWLGMD